MAKSSYLGLALTAESDGEKYFKEYRTEMAGTQKSSNMNLIDQAVKTIAQQLASPLTMKGAVERIEDLAEKTPAINDTYYVTTLFYAVTWNGESWNQSTPDVSAYAQSIADNRADIEALVSLTELTATWESGTISSGSKYDSTTRCRTNYLHCGSGGLAVTIPDGYKVYCHYYSSQSVASYIKADEHGWQTGTAVFHSPADAYAILVCAKIDGSDIAVEEAAQVYISARNLTDTSLSEPGVPADAGATGTALTGKLGYVRMLTSADNLDSLEIGIYLFRNVNGDRPDGLPTTNLGHLIVSRAPNSAFITQLIVTVGGILFSRGKSLTSEFSDWQLATPSTRAMDNIHTILTEADDLDNVSEIGVYYMAGNSLPDHTPATNGGILIVFQSAATIQTYHAQIFLTLNQMFYRYQSSGGWDSWIRVGRADIGQYFDSFVQDITQELVFEQGNIDSSTGENGGAWSARRIRSKFKYSVPASGLEVSVETEGMKLFVYVYDESGNYIKNSGWVDSGYGYTLKYGQLLRFIVAYQDNSEITPDVPFAIQLRSKDSNAFSGLPTVSLTGNFDEISKENKIDVTCNIMGTARVGNCKWQGNSSTRYAKKNYTINKLAIPDVEGDKTGVDAWAMWRSFIQSYWRQTGNISTKLPHESTWGTRRKFVLKANWVDPSEARNLVGARLWSQVVQRRKTRGTSIGQLDYAPNFGAVDGFPVHLLINGVSQGLYTMNLSKDEDLFAMGDGAAEYVVGAENNSSNRPGPRWKAITTSIMSDPPEGTIVDYEIEYAPDGVEDSTVADSLNQAILAAVNAHADWEEALEPYVDLDSIADYFIFACCVAGIDNMAKNILYVSYDGIKWILSAYDLDSTFGYDPYGTTQLEVKNDRNQFAEASEFHRLAHLLVKYSPARLVERYEDLRASVLSDENVWHEFAEFVNFIPENAYRADRETWPDLPGTSTANIHNFMNYYRMHCAYLDKEIAAIKATLE